MTKFEPDSLSVDSGLQIATCPVNWNNNDIPGWRPVTSFPAILDRMREAGYTATEYDGSFGTNASILITEANMRNMTWTGSYQWVDFLDTSHLDEAIHNLKPTFALLNAIGCRNLIVADSLRPHRVAMAGRVPGDGSASLDDNSVRQLADGVQRLASVARDDNIQVRYHNHVGSWIEAPHELDALLTHLDTSLVDLCFDTGHYAYGGGNAADFIAMHHPVIGYLHLKDVNTSAIADARARQLTFIDALKEYVFCSIGAGSADISAILEVLIAHKFDGWVVVEQDTCEGDATITAANNRRFIESWLAERVNKLMDGE